MADPRIFLLQTQSNQSTHETRSVRMACMLMDGLTALNVSVEGLNAHAQMLALGQAMPVGSVEFVREAMKIASIEEPASDPYPASLKPWLKRIVRQRRAGEVLGRWFIKPVQTKLFNGFVFDTMIDPQTLDEHDQEQHAAFLAMPCDALVWQSEPVTFVSEWRYYVDAQGDILGSARYDDGDDGALEPDRIEVEAAAKAGANEFGHGFALDMGVLLEGETALVEKNDVWAIGLYGQALTAKTYTQWLVDRWNTIARKAIV